MRTNRRAARRPRQRGYRPLLLASVRVFEFWLRARILPSDDGAAVTFNVFLNIVRESPEGRRVLAAFVREQGRRATDRARALAGPGPEHSPTAPGAAQKGGRGWASEGRLSAEG